MDMITSELRRAALCDLAPIFEYPYSGYRDHASRWLDAHKDRFAKASESVARFCESINPLSNDQLEEVFTRTFDMAPICSPYISGHLYGADNFERGNLLTALSERYNEANFATNGELPDHIALLLRFSPEMDETEFSELVEYCLSKPLEDMEINLTDNPYQHAVHAVREVLRNND